MESLDRHDRVNSRTRIGDVELDVVSFDLGQVGAVEREVDPRRRDRDPEVRRDPRASLRRQDSQRRRDDRREAAGDGNEEQQVGQRERQLLEPGQLDDRLGLDDNAP